MSMIQEQYIEHEVQLKILNREFSRIESKLN